MIVLADGDEAGEAQRVPLRCAGSTRDAASASLIRHKGWTSTTCCWAERWYWEGCNERRTVSH